MAEEIDDDEYASSLEVDLSSESESESDDEGNKVGNFGIAENSELNQAYAEAHQVRNYFLKTRPFHCANNWGSHIILMHFPKHCANDWGSYFVPQTLC